MGLLIFSAPWLFFSTRILPEVIFLTPGVGPANHLIFPATRYYLFGPFGTLFLTPEMTFSTPNYPEKQQPGNFFGPRRLVAGGRGGAQQEGGVWPQ